MFSIKLSDLISFCSNPDPEIARDSNQFCYCNLSKSKEKCIKFYNGILCNNKKYGFIECPYGFNCYIPEDNPLVVLSSIVSEKSNLKKINSRNKICGYKHDLVYNSELLKYKFDRYSQYLLNASIGNNICHDLNNALNYLIVLAESLKEKCDNVIINYYYEIIRIVSNIQEKTTLESFKFEKDYDKELIIQDFNKLKKYLDKAFRYAESQLKTIDSDVYPNKYCVYAGISLLRTLLRRNLLFADSKIALDDEKTDFSIHKMVKKITLLLGYRAANKNVKFSPFVGSPKKRVIGQSDDIFTMLFTLIDNAIKYSHNDENIYITFIEDNENLTFSLANTSDMLTDYDILHIHDKNYRGSNKSLKGQGLGLYIVKTICERNKIIYKASYKNGMFVYKLTFQDLI